MFFVVANMAEVDPMYQFSLKYFKLLFNNTIQHSEKSRDLSKRLSTLLATTTADVYRNVARFVEVRGGVNESVTLVSEEVIAQGEGISMVIFFSRKLCRVDGMVT